VHAALRCATQHALVTCATEGSCSTRRRCSDAHRTPTCRATFPLILVLQSQRVDGIGDARSLYQAGRRGERSTLLCLEKRARSFMRIPSSRDHTTERLSCPHVHHAHCTTTRRWMPSTGLLEACWGFSSRSASTSLWGECNVDTLCESVHSAHQNICNVRIACTE
jgi:hypothetical protein